MRKKMMTTMLALTMALSPAAVVGTAAPAAAVQESNQSLHTAWTVKLPGTYSHAMAVADNGLAYVVVTKYTEQGAEYTGLVCVDTKDGSIKWEQVLEGIWDGQSPAVGKDGSVYFTMRSLDDQKVSLYAYRPDGTVKWSKQGLIAGQSLSVAPNGDLYMIGHHDDRNQDVVLVFNAAGETIFEHVEPALEMSYRFSYPEEVKFDENGTPYFVYQFEDETVENSLVTIDFANQELKEVFKPGELVSLQQVFAGPDGTIHALGLEYAGYGSPTASFWYAVGENGVQNETPLSAPYATLWMGQNGEVYVSNDQLTGYGDGITLGLKAYSASAPFAQKWETSAFQTMELAAFGGGGTLSDGTFVTEYRTPYTGNEDVTESGLLGFDSKGNLTFKVKTQTESAYVAGDLVLAPTGDTLIAYRQGAGELYTGEDFAPEPVTLNYPELLESLRAETVAEESLNQALGLKYWLLEDGQLSDEERAGYFRQLASLTYEKVGLVEAMDTLKDAVRVVPYALDLYKELGVYFAETGNPDTHVLVNGYQPEFDVLPVVQNARTLVPLRAIGEALGAEIGWDGTTSTITMNKDGHTVVLTLGSSIAYKDGQQVQLDVPAQTVEGRTVVPVRFISEAFGAYVNWIEQGRVAVITDQPAR